MDVHNSILNKLTEEYIAISGVEGIFWGGSSCGCSPEPYSDIDIFIVTDNTVQRRHVLRKVNGVDVEIFINPLDRIYKQMEMEIEEIHDYWVIKIYAFSEIIYDHLGKAGQLKEKALEMFGRTFSDINKNRDLCGIYRMIQIGIDACKMVGRVDRPDQVLEDMKIVSENRKIAMQCWNENEYFEKMIIPDDHENICKLGYSCYFPEIINPKLSLQIKSQG